MTLWVYSVFFVKKSRRQKLTRASGTNVFLTKIKMYKYTLARHGFACCLTAAYF